VTILKRKKKEHSSYDYEEVRKYPFRPALFLKSINAVCLAYVGWARWPKTSGGESGNQLGL
jgi:hypothetical protein